MLRKGAVVCALSWSLTGSLAAQQAPRPASPASLVAEVLKSFTVEGKPVPPNIFRDLGDADIADGVSILVSVDVKAAIGSNLYYGAIKRDGSSFVQSKTNEGTLTGSETMAYRFIGSTKNKLAVVLTAFNGGGSGTFNTLHILDVAAARAFDAEGRVYDRINVTTVREIPLGDRWQGDVTISGNVITIATAPGLNNPGGSDATRRFEAQRPR